MNGTASGKVSPPTDRQASFLGRVVRKIVVLSIIFLAGLIVMSLTATRPSHLGLHGGSLAPVPNSPNCVSSMTDKTGFKATSIDVSKLENPIARLKEIIASDFSRVRLISEEGNYLHYEFTSLIFRFVDDAEFLYDEEQKVIDFRSASRVGHSDLGANRKRIEKIRAAIGL